MAKKGNQDSMRAYEQAMGFSDVHSFQQLGDQLGRILRDVHDPGKIPLLNTKLKALNDRLEAGHATMEFHALFEAFCIAIGRSPSDDEPENLG